MLRILRTKKKKKRKRHLQWVEVKKLGSLKRQIDYLKKSLPCLPATLKDPLIGSKHKRPEMLPFSTKMTTMLADVQRMGRANGGGSQSEHRGSERRHINKRDGSLSACATAPPTKTATYF